MVKIDDAEVLRNGSHFLGSGGGLEVEVSRLTLERQLKLGLPDVLPFDALREDDAVVIVSYMGCPTIEAEKNYNYSHFNKLIEKINHILQNKITAIGMWGVAGGGSFLPVFLSSLFKIPILDADLTGRCFPELQILSTNIAGINPKQAFIFNVMGDVFEIECNNFHSLERHARQATVSSGGCCLIIPQILTGEEAKRGLIPGTLTQAMTIGQIIQETRDLNAVMEYTKGTFVGVGGILLSTGIALPYPFKRRIVIRNEAEGRTWEVWMDNEFNLLFEDGELIAEVPDIITLCNPYTCEPLTIKQLHPHTNVAICTMKAPAIWYTEKGLTLCRTESHLQGRDALRGSSPLMLQQIA